MLLNCTRVKHVYTTLQITQIPRDGQRILINAICRSGAHNSNVLQLLQWRSYNHLHKIRSKAGLGAGAGGTAGAGAGTAANCRWTGRLLNIRGGNLSMKGRRNNSNCKTAEEPKPSKPKHRDYQRLFTLIKTEKKALLSMYAQLVQLIICLVCIPPLINQWNNFSGHWLSLHIIVHYHERALLSGQGHRCALQQGWPHNEHTEQIARAFVDALLPVRHRRIGQLCPCLSVWSSM